VPRMIHHWFTEEERLCVYAASLDVELGCLKAIQRFLWRDIQTIHETKPKLDPPITFMLAHAHAQLHVDTATYL